MKYYIEILFSKNKKNPRPAEVCAKQGTLREMVKALEKDAIAVTLQKTEGNKLRTAKLLDISRRALQYKIEEYGLENIEKNDE